MSTILFFQIITSIILIILVLLQSRDSGLNNPFTATLTGYHTKTAPEKILYIATIITAITFILISLLNISL